MQYDSNSTNDKMCVGGYASIFNWKETHDLYNYYR